IYDAAVAAGIDPKLLQQEKDYFPLMLLDKASVQNPADILSLLTSRLEGKPAPDAGMLKQRQEGAAGEIELDAFSTMLNSMHKAESFIAMAPTATQVAAITGNTEFRRAFNRATYGQGVGILDRFVKHTVRDASGDPIRGYEKMIRYLRLNAKQYFMAAKVLSGVRATLSTVNAWTADPRVIGKWAKHMASLKGGVDWAKYNELKARAEGKSTYVKYRAWDKDFRRRYTGEDAKSFLVGKQRIDKPLMQLITYADKVTVVMNWNSLYDHALDN
ncbi:unnamed protein product, partial [marine sediment metagenome]